MTDSQPLLFLLGRWTMATVALLLALLFLHLRDGRWQRSFFAAWGEAWIALLVSSVALLLAELSDPLAGAPVPASAAVAAEALRAVGEGARVLHFGFLLSGVLSYTRGFAHARWRAAAIGGSLAWGMLVSLAAAGPAAVLAWQAPAAILACGAGGEQILALSRTRQGIGSRITAAALLATAALWVVTLWVLVVGPGGHPVLTMVREAHVTAEVPFVMALGFGMVILRMEDTARDAEDARAELAVANDRLRRLAMYDPLTDCLNRRAYTEGIGLESAKSTFGTVAMLDVDDFKGTNDVHGHAAGDELLAHVAGLLRASTRPRDRLYRWGGDEFLLVMPGATPDGVASRLAQAVAAAPPIPVGPSRVPVHAEVSVGAEAYAGGDELPSAIDAADAAMYRVKRLRKGGAGRDTPATTVRR